MTLEIATITSKRQLTIPAKIFKNTALKEGQRVVIYEEDGILKIESGLSLLDRISGSLKTPKRFKNLTTDEIIKKAKKEHFSKRI